MNAFTCTYCHEHDHYFRNCPKIQCHLCLNWSHQANNCTFGPNTKKKKMIENIKKNAVRTSVNYVDLEHVICLYCRNTGHVNCKLTKYSKANQSVRGSCFLCAGDHPPNICPSTSKAYRYSFPCRLKKSDKSNKLKPSRSSKNVLNHHSQKYGSYEHCKWKFHKNPKNIR